MYLVRLVVHQGGVKTPFVLIKQTALYGDDPVHGPTVQAKLGVLHRNAASKVAHAFVLDWLDDDDTLDEFLEYAQSMRYHEGNNLHAWIRIRSYHMRHPRSDAVAKYCVENFQVHPLLVMSVDTSYRMPGRRLPL